MVKHIVEICMTGINGYIVPYSLNYSTYNVRVTTQLFQSPKNDGMVTHYKIALLFNSFLYYFRCTIQGAQHTTDMPVRRTCDQTSVIVIFLQLKWCNIFQKISNRSNLCHLKSLNRSINEV